MPGAITDPTEIQTIRVWLNSEGDRFFNYVVPDQINDAPLSNLVRFYWFEAEIGAKEYTIGVNIHYGGQFGAIWFTNKDADKTYEMHPHQAPMHHLSQATLKSIRQHAKNKTDSESQYKYTKIKGSYFGEYMNQNGIGSTVYHGKNNDKELFRP